MSETLSTRSSARRCWASALVAAWLLLPVATFAESGQVLWYNLLTHDTKAAAGFYSKLFGWELVEKAPGSYDILHGGRIMGGLSELAKTESGVNEATWLVGIEVDDIGKTLRRTERLGGKVLRGETHAAGYGHWAVLEDPEGAQLLIIDPERSLGGASGHGAWIWAELWTRAVAPAQQFYSKAIGYRGSRNADHPGGPYPVLTNKEGVAQVGFLPIERDDIEPGWAPYVGVDDLTATLTRLRELGGAVLAEPDPDFAQGRIAVVGDPAGVPFLLFQLETP